MNLCNEPFGDHMVADLNFRKSNATTCIAGRPGRSDAQGVQVQVVAQDFSVPQTLGAGGDVAIQVSPFPHSKQAGTTSGLYTSVGSLGPRSDN